MIFIASILNALDAAGDTNPLIDEAWALLELPVVNAEQTTRYYEIIKILEGK